MKAVNSVLGFFNFIFFAGAGFYFSFGFNFGAPKKYIADNRIVKLMLK